MATVPVQSRRTKTASEIYDDIKDALVELGAVNRWQVNNWSVPQAKSEIIPFIRNENVDPESIGRAIANAFGLAFYDPDDHGEPLQSGSGWFITANTLFVEAPFLDICERMLLERSNRRYEFANIGVFAGQQPNINKSTAPQTLGETQMDREINRMIESAIVKGATDIHISQRTALVISIQFRVDSVLRNYRHNIDLKKFEVLCHRLLARVGETPQDITRPHSRKMQHRHGSRDYHIRFEARPVMVGGKRSAFIVLRILNSEGGTRLLDEIGFEPHHEEVLRDLCKRTKGLFLVTGPTGSGKTTTLYSLLQKVLELRPGDSVQTLEDPVEVEIPGLRQTSVVNEQTMTFQSGVRSALRSDPEVILIGEIRDLETAEQAIVAAETGHLVFGTLHTNSAASTINRLVGLRVERVALANVLVAISAQRIVRKVCQHCSKQVRFGDVPLWVKYYGDLRSAPGENDYVRIANPNGCEICDRIGYKDRHVVCELMMIDPSTERMIIDNSPAIEIENSHIEHGYEPLWGHGISLVAKGLTTIDELESRLEPRNIYGNNFNYDAYRDEMAIKQKAAKLQDSIFD